MTQEPPNCSTCKTTNCPTWILEDSLKLAQAGKMTMNPIGAVVCTLGCLYHSDARAWLMRDVIKDLKTRKSLAPDRIEWVYGECISAIKDGSDENLLDFDELEILEAWYRAIDCGGLANFNLQEILTIDIGKAEDVDIVTAMIRELQQNPLKVIARGRREEWWKK